MRILFMGTPDFSVPTLQTLIDSKHEVIGVVTQPDKPRGRGKKVTYSPIKEVAIQNNIEVYQPQKVREEQFMDKLREMNPDLIVVIAFGQILKKDLLELPKYGCINVHASLLPKYRGAGPIQWSIINGEKETGITTMHMDVGLDTGDMILKESVIIENSDTYGTLHDKLSLIGAKVLLDTIEQIEKGIAPRIKQNDDESTYAPMLSKELGKIDWTKGAEEIERLIRGLNPWPSAYTSLDGKTLKIWQAKVTDTSSEGTVGEVVKVTKDAIVIKTGTKDLALTEIQLQGKKRMATEAFLKGYKLEENTKLD